VGSLFQVVSEHSGRLKRLLRSPDFIEVARPEPERFRARNDTIILSLRGVHMDDEAIYLG
jgi:hypothetical protein